MFVFAATRPQERAAAGRPGPGSAAASLETQTKHDPNTASNQIIWTAQEYDIMFHRH